MTSAYLNSSGDKAGANLGQEVCPLWGILTPTPNQTEIIRNTKILNLNALMKDPIHD